VPLLRPTHPRTRARLAQLGEEASKAPGVLLTEPLAYLEFL
jgi:hypothetical protein